MTSRLIWMPVDGDCVVSGQIFGFSQDWTIYLDLVARLCFSIMDF